MVKITPHILIQSLDIIILHTLTSPAPDCYRSNSSSLLNLVSSDLAVSKFWNGQYKYVLQGLMAISEIYLESENPDILLYVWCWISASYRI